MPSQSYKDFFDALAHLQVDADKLREVVQGDENTTVPTIAGPLDSVAKILADMKASIEAAGDGLLAQTQQAAAAAATSETNAADSATSADASEAAAGASETAAQQFEAAAAASKTTAASSAAAAQQSATAADADAAAVADDRALVSSYANVAQQSATAANEDAAATAADRLQVASDAAATAADRTQVATDAAAAAADALAALNAKIAAINAAEASGIVAYADSYADALARVGSLADGDPILIFTDENAGGARTIRQVSGATLSAPKAVLDGDAITTSTSAPTANDDSSQGYNLRSLWFVTGGATVEIYRCVDATPGAAAWVTTSLTLDDLGSAATADVGTGASQLPRNSDLGSAATADVGTGASQLPTNAQIDVSGQVETALSASGLGEYPISLNSGHDLDDYGRGDFGFYYWGTQPANAPFPTRSVMLVMQLATGSGATQLVFGANNELAYRTDSGGPTPTWSAWAKPLTDANGIQGNIGANNLILSNGVLMLETQ